MQRTPAALLQWRVEVACYKRANSEALADAYQASEGAEPGAAEEAVPDPVMHVEPPEVRGDEGDGHDGSEDGEAPEVRELQYQCAPCEPTQEMRDAQTAVTGRRVRGAATA